MLVLPAAYPSASAAEARRWTSRSGTFSVEADLVNVEGEIVVLKRADGNLIRVPLAQLSLGDVQYVREAMTAAGMAVEPSAAAATEAPAESSAKPAADTLPPWP